MTPLMKVLHTDDTFTVIFVLFSELHAHDGAAVLMSSGSSDNILPTYLPTHPPTYLTLNYILTMAHVSPSNMFVLPKRSSVRLQPYL